MMASKTVTLAEKDEPHSLDGHALTCSHARTVMRLHGGLLLVCCLECGTYEYQQQPAKRTSDPGVTPKARGWVK